MLVYGALIINTIIIILEIFTLLKIKRKIDILKYYTYFQNLISLITSFVFVIVVGYSLICNESMPGFIKGLRYLSVVGLLFTTFIFVVFLQNGKKIKMNENDFKQGIKPTIANIIFHYILPGLSFISFVAFEREIILINNIWTLIVSIISCLYWITYLILTSFKLWNEPYEFFQKKQKHLLLDILFIIFIPIVFVLISNVLWFII